MPRHTVGARALLVTLAFNLTFVPVWAQEAAPAPPVAPADAPAAAPSVPPAADLPPQNPQTLREVVKEIVWKPEQGTLIIVAPGRIRPPYETITNEQGEPTTALPSALPERAPGEGLRLSALESYFGVRGVACGGGVTALAPSKMWVLNYRNLPKPSPYAGLKAADSFRLLQSTLTEAQWRQMCSPRGLGLGDVSGEQRALFLAAVPVGTRIEDPSDYAAPLPVVEDAPGSVSSAPGEAPAETVTAPQSDPAPNVLNEAAQQNVRIRIAREMTAMIRLQGTGSIGMASNQQSGRTAMLPENGETGGERRAFGVELMQQVTAYAKPGHLPFDWEALQTDVDLQGVKTVGELVERARKATGAQLCCDPRYRRLTVHIRGDRAPASGLLKALARGVTGTWRRVENAYVLTDDLTGLGVRQALISEWVAQNNALVAQVDRTLWQALAKAQPAQYVEDEETGDNRPNPALFAAFKREREEMLKPRGPGDAFPARDKGIPIGDLPPKMQEAVRRLLPTVKAEDYGPDARLDTERVSVQFQTVVRWEVPGVGTVTPPYSGADLVAMSEGMEMMQGQMGLMLQSGKRPLPPQFTTRALVLSPGKDEQNFKALRAARRAGFTEIWVTASSDGDDAIRTVEAVAASARQMGLKTRVVVSALRAVPSKDKAAEGADRNLLDETYTETLGRRLGWGAWPSAGSMNPMAAFLPDMADSGANAEDVARQDRARGDWLDPVTPGIEVTALARVKKAASLRGIDGIVVRDLLPPGYEADPLAQYGRVSTTPPVLQGGYSLARRTAFLKRHGSDPIDFSSAGYGMGSGAAGFRQPSYVHLELPLFSEMGGDEDGIGESKLEDLGDKPGAGKPEAVSPAVEWSLMRQEDGEKAVRRIVAALQAEKPRLPVWYYQTPAAGVFSSGPPIVESRDKAEPPLPTTKLTPEEEVSRGMTPPKAVRARSSSVLFALPIGVMQQEIGLGTRGTLGMLTQLLFDPVLSPSDTLKGWDGLVIDLSHETPGSVAAVLDVFADPKPAAPSKPVAKRPGRP